MLGGFSGLGKQINWFDAILLAIVWILYIIATFLYMFVPNLVITFKTKGASPSVDIRAKKRTGFLSFIGLTSQNDVEFTGFDEVMPAKETDVAMKEVTAMINDLKTIGDLAIEKWKK
ncbi:hypothetical protein FACS1894188_12670 [Clostridia bacterium]|nr:hypothetical protein FACS1894188_12670 [Clostridia bacterium]